MITGVHWFFWVHRRVVTGHHDSMGPSQSNDTRNGVHDEQDGTYREGPEP